MSFCVSVIHRTTRSLTWVRSYACVYTRGWGTPTTSQHNILTRKKLSQFVLVLRMGFEPLPMESIGSRGRRSTNWATTSHNTHSQSVSRCLSAAMVSPLSRSPFLSVSQSWNPAVGALRTQKLRIPHGESPGLSEVPSLFKPRVHRNVALNNMLCPLSSWPLAYWFLPSCVILLHFLQNLSKKRLWNVGNCEKTLTKMHCASPWYNRHGWLSVKHWPITYLPANPKSSQSLCSRC